MEKFRPCFSGRFIPALLFVLFIFSCTGDHYVTPGDGSGELSVATARRFFEGFEGPIGFDPQAASRGEVDSLRGKIVPMWELARNFVYKGMPVVEVPLNIANAWIEKHDGDLEAITLKRLQQFSGRVLFSTVAGEFICGGLYRQGVVRGIMRLGEEESPHYWPLKPVLPG